MPEDTHNFCSLQRCPRDNTFRCCHFCKETDCMDKCQNHPDKCGKYHYLRNNEERECFM